MLRRFMSNLLLVENLILFAECFQIENRSINIQIQNMSDAGHGARHMELLLPGVAAICCID